jgi:hypothetical protein
VALARYGDARWGRRGRSLSWLGVLWKDESVCMSLARDEVDSRMCPETTGCMFLRSHLL